MTKISILFIMFMAIVGSKAVWAQQSEQRTSFREGTQYISGSLQSYLQKGMTAYQDKNYKEAISFLNNALSINPANEQAIIYLSKSLIELGRYDEAIVVLTEGARVLPDNLEIQRHLAKTYITIGLVGEAVRLLENLVDENPYHGPLYITLASAYIVEQRYSRANTILDKAIFLNAATIETYYLKAIAQMMRFDYASALETINYASELFGEEGPDDLLLVKAQVLYRQDASQFQQALDLINQAIEARPEDFRPYNILVDIYISELNFTAAHQVLDRALENGVNEIVIEEKRLAIEQIRMDTKRFEIETKTNSWIANYKEYWGDFYLNAVWYLNKVSSLALGLDQHIRNNKYDALISVRYSHKINQWIYVSTKLAINLNQNEREKLQAGLDIEGRINPFSFGETHVSLNNLAKFFNDRNVLLVTVDIEQFFTDKASLAVTMDNVISSEDGHKLLFMLKANVYAFKQLDFYLEIGNKIQLVSGEASDGFSLGAGMSLPLGERWFFEVNYSFEQSEQQGQGHRLGLNFRVELPIRK